MSGQFSDEDASVRGPGHPAPRHTPGGQLAPRRHARDDDPGQGHGDRGTRQAEHKAGDDVGHVVHVGSHPRRADECRDDEQRETPDPTRSENDSSDGCGERGVVGRKPVVGRVGEEWCLAVDDERARVVPDQAGALDRDQGDDDHGHPTNGQPQPPSRVGLPPDGERSDDDEHDGPLGSGYDDDIHPGALPHSAAVCLDATGRAAEGIMGGMIPTQPFGRTGHDSTRIIFGAAALSRVTQDEADATLELVASRGINHLDVARSYGEAEVRMKPFLSEHRDAYFLATKTEDRTAEGAYAQINESLERMGTDHVDLLQLHNLVDEERVADRLREGRRAGGSPPGARRGPDQGGGRDGPRVTVARQHLRSLQEYDFASVLLPYNFPMSHNERYLADVEELVAVCQERGVAVQTIKSITKAAWPDADRESGSNGDREQHFAATWYEPLRSPEAIDTAVSWVLGRGGRLPRHRRRHPPAPARARRGQPVHRPPQRRGDGPCSRPRRHGAALRLVLSRRLRSARPAARRWRRWRRAAHAAAGRSPGPNGPAAGPAGAGRTPC